MNLLFACIASLILGPVVYVAARTRDALLAVIDGFVFMAISGLVLLYILPDSFASGGWLTLLFVLVGFFGPTLMEQNFKKAARQAHLAALVLGIVGLCLHSLIDGTALSAPPESPVTHHNVLPYAVILHRFPVGLTIWWLLRPAYGIWTAGAILALMSGSTIAGFFLGPHLTTGLSTQGIAWFQALVGGSLLHVVMHQPHAKGADCGCASPLASNRHFEGVGSVLGVALLLALLFGASLSGGPGGESEIARTFWVLSLESAPALLLAYIMAGMMSAFLSRSSVAWMRAGSSWSQALRGMAVGLPFPVCSCGVVPLYRALIRQGAPATAAMAFLIATPELGLDAVLISIPLLGAEMTLIRVLAAAAVALLVGRIVGPLVQTGGAFVTQGEERPEAMNSLSILRRSWEGLKTGLGEVVDHTAPWIVLGLLIAAVAEPFLAAGWLQVVPKGIEVPLFALLGVPAYVCASGATPFVAVLLFNGVSPGAGLAFLLTGPATNVTTFGLLATLHGRRVALVFSLTIIVLALSLGYLVNFLLPETGGISLSTLEAEPATLIQTFSLTLLAAAYLFSLLRRGGRRFVGELSFKEGSLAD